MYSSCVQDLLHSIQMTFLRAKTTGKCRTMTEIATRIHSKGRIAIAISVADALEHEDPTRAGVATSSIYIVMIMVKLLVFLKVS